MELKIAIAGDHQAAARLDRLGQKAAHARPVLNRIVDQLIQLEQQRFDKGRFKRLAPSTRRRKARHHQDPRPLRATGALMRSLTVKHGPNQLLQINNNELVFGTKVHYAVFHATGKGTPKRKPIDVTPKQREPIARTILDFLTRA